MAGESLTTDCQPMPETLHRRSHQRAEMANLISPDTLGPHKTLYLSRTPPLIVGTRTRAWRVKAIPIDSDMEEIMQQDRVAWTWPANAVARSHM
jgi:hypothetical protein